jgi:hypothetical protein
MLLPLLMNLGMFGTSVDTHDGGDDTRRKRADAARKRRDEERIAYRDKLRADIRLALLGPEAEEVREELAPYAAPSEAKPFWETVDLEAVADRIEKLVTLKAELARIAHERMLDEDDEEVLLLI